MSDQNLPGDSASGFYDSDVNKRREFLKKGVCLLCCAIAGKPGGHLLFGDTPVSSEPVCTEISQRTFRLKLRPFAERLEARWLFWLRNLLERLGREKTLEIWGLANKTHDDKFMLEILSGPWQPEDTVQEEKREDSLSTLLDTVWKKPVEGIRRDQAKQLVLQAIPFPAIREKLPSLDISREITAYQSLHLYHHGIARLAESMIEKLGKQGELIAYDIIRAYRVQQSGGQTVSVETFMRSFTEIPKTPDIFTAGTTIQFRKVTPTEVTALVKECEWSRYFRNNHPRVGYLVACSTDEAAYRSQNPRIRMQRTSTLMEGGNACDFRVYSTG